MFSTNGFSQLVGLNNPTPDPSSVLDMVANNRGVLIPRMTTIERLAIVSPANGLLVYDTDLSTFYYYDTPPLLWRPLNSSAVGPALTAWSINGNAGIVDGTDYVGTNGAVDFDLRTNGTERISIDGSIGNVSIGTTTTAAMFHVSSPNTTPQTVFFDQYQSGSNFRLRRANGTSTVPTALAIAEVMGNLNFAGYNSAAFTSSNAFIRSTTTEGWTAIANGSKLELGTTANGANSPTTAMTIDETQKVKIGTTDQFQVASTGNTTLADATLWDMSAVNGSSTTEGIKLPQGADVSTGTAEGQAQWDTDGDLLQIGDGAKTKTIGVANNIQVFTADGTWIRPPGVTKVWVKVWGGGADGGDGGSFIINWSGAGGGGGGYAEGLIEVTGNVTVTVGGAGGTSSFAGVTTIQATGGNSPALLAGGTAGVGSGGTINLTGGAGGTAKLHAGASGGRGGGSPMGGAGGAGGAGGNANSPNVNGTAGIFPGGGGGGGSHSTGNGASGAGGLVIVYY